MFHDQRPSTSHGLESNRDGQHIRDIHALIPPHPPPSNARARRTETWETSSDGGASTENFPTMSREISALLLAGSDAGNQNSGHEDNENTGNNLARIGEDQEMAEETNPFAIVPDRNYPLALDPIASPSRRREGYGEARSLLGGDQGGEVWVQRVKKEEVETKISAWQNAKVAKINNRFKREDAVINGWEGEQVLKATSWMKKVERKLEEKRARAQEKMQNDVAKARRKAEDRRASAEAKRGTKVARILEIANLLRTVGRPPVKRSFF